jgi:hypothetical protein
MPEGWRRSIIGAMLLVVGIFFVVGLISRQLPKSPESREPVIPVYPEAYEVKNLVAPERGWHRIIFQVEDDYPSRKILDYYTRKLSAQGYRLSDPTTAPDWQPVTVEKKFRRLALQQAWIDPRQLHVLELEIVAVEIFRWDEAGERVVSREMRPGLEVMLTLSRKVIIPGKSGTSPQG